MGLLVAAAATGLALLASPVPVPAPGRVFPVAFVCGSVGVACDDDDGGAAAYHSALHPMVLALQTQKPQAIVELEKPQDFKAAARAAASPAAKTRCSTRARP